MTAQKKSEGGGQGADHAQWLGGVEMGPDIEQRGSDEGGVQQRGGQAGAHDLFWSRGGLSRPARSASRAAWTRLPTSNLVRMALT
ncbi:hypothetical protein SAURM35S_04281 [Streptomyces aurantiogriseus]